MVAHDPTKLPKQTTGSYSIFVDGSCRNRSFSMKDGGWAWHSSAGGAYYCEQGGVRGKHEEGEGTTNNQMEILAPIRALLALPHPRCSVVFLTDSKYVIGGATVWRPAWERRGWRNIEGQPVKNKELWQRLHMLTDMHRVAWTWVKGHNGNEGNEHADALATQGRLFGPYNTVFGWAGIAPEIE